ncbi:MAG: HEPN domain-containing protein [Candidatus ainarchaeum sp.]|nr:HEPN domain-containing protein [Candidatus ainarchaeum sp.]
MIDFNECLAKGLLARIPASREKALQSIEKAKELLEEAKASLEEERINSTVIVAYLAIFHAARALLFKDGYREKSHECVIRYLEEKYPEIKPGQIEALEKYKSERTHTQYDVSYNPSEEQAEKMIKFTEKFIQTIEEMI